MRFKNQLVLLALVLWEEWW